MLALTEDGIHDMMWSDDLLDEWERVIVRERHRSPDAAAAITATIRQFFADTRIPVESYEGLIAEVDGPDPDDNAHMAAAVAGQVELLVTWNRKDFDCGFTRKHVIRSDHPASDLPTGSSRECTSHRSQLAIDVPLPVLIDIRVDQMHPDLCEHAHRGGVRRPDARIEVHVMALGPVHNSLRCLCRQSAAAVLRQDAAPHVQSIHVSAGPTGMERPRSQATDWSAPGALVRTCVAAVIRRRLL